MFEYRFDDGNWYPARLVGRRKSGAWAMEINRSANGEFWELISIPLSQLDRVRKQKIKTPTVAKAA